MAKVTYAPLEFMKQWSILGGFKERDLWDNYYSFMLNGSFHVPKDKTPSLDWLIKYAMGGDFMQTCKLHLAECTDDKHYINLIDEYGLEDFLDTECIKFASENSKSLPGLEVSNANVIKAEMRDMFVQPALFGKWARNKQVLKPDPIFLKYLLDTKELVIKRDFFEHLPFTTFYIDLEDPKKEVDFGNVSGVFVDILRTADDEVSLAIIVLTNELQHYSFYWNFPTDKESKSLVDDIPVAPTARETLKTGFNFRMIAIMVVQMICYMKVKEPDINATPEMKHTYKPSKHGGKITNSYNEVYKQEVGIRIGKKISINIKEMKKAEKEESVKAKAHGHKSPIPHFRSAHWHGYWCGHGDDKKLETRWIEPVFVCGSYSSDNSDVIIHKVTE